MSIDSITAGMKRSAMAAEYHRRLAEIIPTFDPDAPIFDRDIDTTSMRLGIIAAARQGFDAGRYGTASDCPYPMGASVLDTLARRAWMVGFSKGMAVTPRPEPRTLAQQPIVIR